jgi:hypothetical protein
MTVLKVRRGLKMVKHFNGRESVMLKVKSSPPKIRDTEREKTVDDGNQEYDSIDFIGGGNDDPPSFVDGPGPHANQLTQSEAEKAEKKARRKEKYKKSQERLAERWKALMSKENKEHWHLVLYNLDVKVDCEGCANPSDIKTAVVCNTCKGKFCADCGEKHASRNLKHVVFDIFGNPVDNCFGIAAQLHNGCDCTGTDSICLITENGFKHVTVKGCSLYNTAEIMMQNGIWPLAPESPKYGIDVELMKKAYALTMVYGSSLMKVFDFLKMSWDLQHVRPFPTFNIYTLYRNGRESFYNFFALMDAMEDWGDECPVCFNELSDLPLVFSVDGNFQLCRRSDSGYTHRPPLIEGVYTECLATGTSIEKVDGNCQHRAGSEVTQVIIFRMFPLIL